MNQFRWMYRVLILVVGCVPVGLLFFAVSAETAPLSSPSSTSIEIANISGIEGQTIGIFGNDFGSTQGSGSVTILGSAAAIGTWSDTFISATVPSVANGTGLLQLTTDSGITATSPFTVYSVDTNFLVPIDPELTNIFSGKTAVLHNLESSFCFRQPGNSNTAATEFLTDYHCGFAGYTNSGSAEFTADSSLGQAGIVAVDVGQTLAGNYYFQFFSENNWYPRLDEVSYRHSFPRDYTVQISADSTNGLDGTWTSVITVTNNIRSIRNHHFTVSSSSASWVRLHVTDGITDHTATAGRDFSLREVRLYEANTASTLRPDSVAHYGDSLSADAFQLIGPQGFAELARTTSTPTPSNDLMFTSFGLSGQNSSGFVDQPTVDYDIHDALALDNLDTHALYWGLSIGVNDVANGAANISNPNSNIYHYPARLDTIVQTLIAQGRVPILARITDTDESQGGFGDLASKKHVLEAIDTVAATYGLIPGPDLYTAFRLNIEQDGASYFKGDGTHHVTAGQARMVELWAEAFAAGTAQSLTPTGTTLASVSAENPFHDPTWHKLGFLLLLMVTLPILHQSGQLKRSSYSG